LELVSVYVFFVYVCNNLLIIFWTCWPTIFQQHTNTKMKRVSISFSLSLSKNLFYSYLLSFLIIIFFFFLICVNAGNINSLFIASPAINIIVLRFARGRWVQTSAAGFTTETHFMPFLTPCANFFHCIDCFGAFWAICWIRHLFFACLHGWFDFD